MAGPGDVMIRLATRSSALAMLQADLVGQALAETLAVRSEHVLVQSAGDLRLDVPIHAIGGRGVFVKEIDLAVAERRADAAVHSAKDLSSGAFGTPGNTLVIGAYLKRADPRDGLVGRPLGELPPGARIATGSVRRRAQLAWLRPDLTFEDLRGNIAARLRKVPEGGAVVVAMAALERLGIAERASQIFSVTEMLPQVGQGAIAVSCRGDDAETLRLLAAIDHEPTRLAVEAERAWLASVGGGCDLPVGAFARLDGREIEIEAMIASLDGHVMVRAKARGVEPQGIGQSLAAEMLDRRGGRALLEPGPP